jgi:hypothetical protein
MEDLNILKQALELAFSCGKICKLEDIRLLMIALQNIEEKLKAPQLTQAPEVKK